MSSSGFILKKKKKKKLSSFGKEMMAGLCVHHKSTFWKSKISNPEILLSPRFGGKIELRVGIRCQDV